MSTATATLPSPAAVKPQAPAAKPLEKTIVPPVVAKEVPGEKTEAPKREARPKPAAKEVPHDWVPRGDQERIAEGLGEIKRLPKPEDAAAAAEKAAADIAAKGKTDERQSLAVDDDKGFDESDLKGQTLPPVMRKALDVRNHQVREERRQRKEIEAKLAELEPQAAEAGSLRARLADLEKAPKIDAVTESKLKEHDALLKRVEEMEGYFAATKIEMTADYRREIGGPLAGVKTMVGEIAKRYDADGKEALSKKLEIAFSLSGDEKADELEILTEGMKGLDRTKILQAAADHELLMGAREQMLSDAKGRLAGMEQQQQVLTAKQQQEAEQRTVAAKAEYDKLVQDKFPEVLKEAGLAHVDGSEDFNRSLDGVLEWVQKTPFDALQPAAQATAMNRAAVFPFVLAKLVAREETIAEMEVELSKYRGAKPGAGEGGRNGHSEAAEPDDKGKSYGEGAVERMRKAAPGWFTR